MTMGFRPLWLVIVLLAALAGACAQTPPAKQKAPEKAAVQALVDINSASVEELKKLNGVGDAYAARIVKGRPYRAKNELAQKGILPSATYEKIKDQIIARQK
jgi:competence protein ComEA